MKKGFVKIIVAILSVCLLGTGLFACGTSSWNKDDVTLKNWGEVESTYGFVAATKNYIYYINGVGDSEENNAFGAPVKGALMAASKTDLEKTELVVPKLFVAKDYNAGLFIAGDYVYYGTPSTDTNSQGAIAKDMLTFAKTKLDGSETKMFFTVDSLDCEYRMVKDADGNVHIVYYDKAETKLVDFNTETETEVVIAETSDEVKRETLSSYKFAKAEGVEGAVVIYTTDVYDKDFNAEEKELLGASYVRQTESYNKVYAYKVGDEKVDDCAGVNVLNGDKAIPVKYTLSYVSGQYVFIKEADNTSVDTSKTYAITTADLHAKGDMQVVNNATLLTDTTVIESLTEAYYVKDEYIRTTTLVGDNKLAEKIVAKAEKVGTLYFVEGDYIYYKNSDDRLSRLKVKNVDETVGADITEQYVSEGKIATDWYKPQVLFGKVFYIDASATGLSYVGYVALNAELDESKNDQGKTTYVALKNTKVIAKMTDADTVSLFEAKVANVTTGLSNGKVVLNAKDSAGEFTSMEVLNVAKEAYEKLTNAQKNMVNKETLALYKKYLKAVDVSVLLGVFDGFNGLSETAKEELRDDYEAVLDVLDALAKEGYKKDEILSIVVENASYYYQQAGKYFTAE